MTDAVWVPVVLFLGLQALQTIQVAILGRAVKKSLTPPPLPPLDDPTVVAVLAALRDSHKPPAVPPKV